MGFCSRILRYDHSNDMRGFLKDTPLVNYGERSELQGHGSVGLGIERVPGWRKMGILTGSEYRHTSPQAPATAASDAESARGTPTGHAASLQLQAAVQSPQAALAAAKT